ncbi:molybdenum cofactor biosynthesis protein [Candidatus Geothermarchaeota archaeon ex4572_27]|nr:MAG: molybdenum cofactor biosynthesis protein [Candidatus Geothermarchaeota archaeon ex4572_27]
MSRYTGHERRAKVDIKAAVITVSTSRYRARGRGEEVRDDSGDIAESLLKAHGFEVVARELVPDDRGHIRGAVERCRSRANLLILIGGTGVSPTDVTVEAIRPILDKELTLFPALFAYLSYADVGTACLPSRVLAGVTGLRRLALRPRGTLDLQYVLPPPAHRAYIAYAGASADPTRRVWLLG